MNIAAVKVAESNETTRAEAKQLQGHHNFQFHPHSLNTMCIEYQGMVSSHRERVAVIGMVGNPDYFSALCPFSTCKCYNCGKIGHT